MMHQRLLPRDGVSAKIQYLMRNKSINIDGVLNFLDDNPLSCLYTMPEELIVEKSV
jgi:hypothetical protein